MFTKKAFCQKFQKSHRQILIHRLFRGKLVLMPGCNITANGQLKHLDEGYRQRLQHGDVPGFGHCH